MIQFTVTGTPAPQGSKRAFNHRTTGRVVLVEDANKTQKAWRHDVKTAALNALAEQATTTAITGPVRICIDFFMPRPKYHYGTGRNAHLLKAGAPRHVDKKPDIDKLVRSTLDAITDACLWNDDAQVAALQVTKTYATGRPAGALISVFPMSPAPASSQPSPQGAGAASPTPVAAPTSTPDAATVQGALL